jgi:glyoxylase-like metal-dependent hydrolase (beta-lactamase superfamily II)
VISSWIKVYTRPLYIGTIKVTDVYVFFKPIYVNIQLVLHDSGTTFVVDAFRYGAVAGCSAYFLTHFHTDHYGGLTKSWDNGPIYCTPITARLLALCLRVNERYLTTLRTLKLGV